MKLRCPCHSGLAYENCCQALHFGQAAPSPERLMRSRYCAYSLKMADYLQSSWYHSTRPSHLSKADLQGISWLGLKIIETFTQDAQHGTVTFKAKFRIGTQKTQTLYEKSHFVLENGHWYYVSGDLLSE